MQLAVPLVLGQGSTEARADRRGLRRHGPARDRDEIAGFTPLGPEARESNRVWRYGGFRCRLMKDGKSIVVIDPLELHHRGGGGSEAVNGAIIAYLFDCGMGAACDSLWLGVPVEKHRTSTMDMAISYVRPVYGDVCQCESYVVGGGRNVVYTRGEVKDAQGTVCAHALASYRIWPGGERVVEMPGPPIPEFKPDAPEGSSY